MKINELSEMRKVIDSIATEMRAGMREGSVMTTYGNGEKDVWRNSVASG
jgi:hypothetical protein